jgi:hypothetical protein
MTGKKLTKESGMGAALLRIIIDKWEPVRKTCLIESYGKLMMYGFQGSCPPVSTYPQAAMMNSVGMHIKG